MQQPNYPRAARVWYLQLASSCGSKPLLIVAPVSDTRYVILCGPVYFFCMQLQFIYGDRGRIYVPPDRMQFVMWMSFEGPRVKE